MVESPRLIAFVINLAGAPERWAYMQKSFAGSELELVRVEAVNGAEFPEQPAGYDEGSFQRRHGRTTNLREVGCYHSHVAACEKFLASSQEHALICEDDIAFQPGCMEVIKALLQRAPCWDIARLSGLKQAPGIDTQELKTGYAMRINFGRLKGTGAYLLNRRAARAFVKHLLPMRVPFDHAIDREWRYGLTAVSVSPFPVDQTGTGFRTSIQQGPARKLGWLRRAAFTYPYQAINELSRWVARGVSLVMCGRGQPAAQDACPTPCKIRVRLWARPQ